MICNVVRYNPREDLKSQAIMIVHFDNEVAEFRRIVRKLLFLNESFANWFFPMKTEEFTDIGIISKSLYTDLTSEATITFLDRLNFMLHFNYGTLKGSIKKEELSKWGVQNLSGVFEGDIHKKIILTNYRFGQEHDKQTESYYFSLRS